MKNVTFFLHKDTHPMQEKLTVCSCHSRTSFRVNPESNAPSDTVKCNVQMSTHNTAQAFGQFG